MRRIKIMPKRGRPRTGRLPLDTQVMALRVPVELGEALRAHYPDPIERAQVLRSALDQLSHPPIISE